MVDHNEIAASIARHFSTGKMVGGLTLHDVVLDALRIVQAAERERCARLAEKRAGPFGGVGLLVDFVDLAAEIRKGQEPTS